MAGRSAGLILYRERDGTLEVLLVHPGGPFWANKDHGAWSIPKGEYAPGEDPEAVARREFAEELGIAIEGEFLRLGDVRQTGGKVVTAFTREGAFDTARVKSNRFELEWPPRSGRRQSFPEVDRAEWFPLEVAREKLIAGQRPLLELLLGMVRPAGKVPA